MKFSALEPVVADSPVERLLRWEQGETPGPWYVSVFPTNRCNLRCSMCWQRQCDVDLDTEVSDERLIKLIDECAEHGPMEWVFAGGGEPMLRGDLLTRLCERIRSHEMNGALQTNGTVFKQEFFERLFDAQWLRIAFSIDGPTPEINDAIRSDGAFEKACANIRQVSSLRDQRTAKSTSLLMFTVLTALNFGKLDKMVDLARDLGCDEIQLSRLSVQGNTGEPLRLHKEHLSLLPDSLRAGIKRAEQLGIRENFGSFLPDQLQHDAAAWSRFRAVKGGLLNAPCLEPWLGFAVHADGCASPCCILWNEAAQNIRDMSFDDIWLGPFMQHVRKEMLTGRLPEACAKCPSGVRARNDAVMRMLLWARMSPFQRVQLMGAKAFYSARRYGVRGAFGRARDWFKIMRSRD